MEALRLAKRGVDMGDQEERLCWLIATFLVVAIFAVSASITLPVLRQTFTTLAMKMFSRTGHTATILWIFVAVVETVILAITTPQQRNAPILITLKLSRVARSSAAVLVGAVLAIYESITHPAFMDTLSAVFARNIAFRLMSSCEQ